MPYKARLCTERYVRHRLLEHMEQHDPPMYAALSAGVEQFGRADESTGPRALHRLSQAILVRKGAPRPYYSPKEREALHLAFDLYERDRIEEFLTRVMWPIIDAGLWVRYETLRKAVTGR